MMDAISAEPNDPDVTPPPMDRRETYAFVAFVIALITANLYTLSLLDDMREHQDDPLLWLFVICSTNTAACCYWFLFIIHLLRQLGKLFVQYRYLIWLDLITFLFTATSWIAWMDYHSRMDIGLMDIFLMPAGITGMLTMIFLLVAIFLHFRLSVPIEIKEEGDKI